MKNKAPLALIEQVIMLLVLAVAATACLQVFVQSHLTARESHYHDLSLQQMQIAAETMKSTGGDLEKTAAMVGGAVENGCLTITAEGYTVILKKTSSGQPLLGKAQLTAVRDGEILSQMEVCWQEVAP